MNKLNLFPAFIVCLLLASAAVLFPGDSAGRAAGEDLWPTKGWATASPGSVGLDEQVLLSLGQGYGLRKVFPMMDSFAVFRCGKKVFERTYSHDYAKIYAKEAGEQGPLNARLTGRYNYFDSYWHPYYHGTDLHTMQSVSKTVTSVIIGAAMQRGDFKTGLDTPVLKYFDAAKVKNVDDRKRRMTLRDLLTMTTGLQWNEDVPYDDPRSDSSLMEATDDWVQYAIDKPMAAEPGTVWNYSSGVTELLAYIFQKESDGTLTNTDRNFCSSRWGSSTNGSVPTWSGGHGRRPVFERRRAGEDRILIFARWRVGRQADGLE